MVAGNSQPRRASTATAAGLAFPMSLPSQDFLLEAKDGPEYIHISFDIDTLDPAYAPGTGTPEPGGLTPREVFPIVRRLCAESNVVGFDLIERDPERDPTYVTTMKVNPVRECLSGIAMRKKGLIEEHDLSPPDDEQSPPGRLAPRARIPFWPGSSDSSHLTPLTGRRYEC